MSEAAGSKEMTTDTLPAFSRILLVTDFSPWSEAAVPFAKLLTESYRASITIAHVILRDIDFGPNEAVIGTQEEIAELAETLMRRFLAKNSLSESDFVITSGPFGDAIAAAIEQKAIDLVVAGTHGRSGVGKLLLGSIAQRIFNAAPCPVLTVSPRARRSGGVEGKRKILYAPRLSDASLKALPYALSLAKTMDAELLLVHVLESSQLIAQQGRINEDLSEMLPPEARGWCRSNNLVLTGDPASEIVRVAAEYGVDFIVIGAERVPGGPLDRINVPLTTAYQIVAHADCPVLRVRN
jgi:nucleotide-binding universal stress UspA family protein